MELRIREPRVEEAPSRLGVASAVELPSAVEDWRAGVSRTSLRNWELFIVALEAKSIDCRWDVVDEMRLGILDGGGLSLVYH